MVEGRRAGGRHRTMCVDTAWIHGLVSVQPALCWWSILQVILLTFLPFPLDTVPNRHHFPEATFTTLAAFALSKGLQHLRE